MQIVGGACGFLYALILLRIGHLPDLPPEISCCVYEVGRLFAGPFIFTNNKRQVTANPR
jgi:hypothetical protein